MTGLTLHGNPVSQSETKHGTFSTTHRTYNQPFLCYRLCVLGFSQQQMENIWKLVSVFSRYRIFFLVHIS